MVMSLNYFYIPIGLFWIFLVLKKDIKTRTVAVIIILLIGVSNLVNSDLLKPVFQRTRPYKTMSKVHYYKKHNWHITSKIEKTKESYRLKAKIWGEPYNPERHPQKVGIKAVTYHRMEIVKRPEKVTLKFILDI